MKLVSFFGIIISISYRLSVVLADTQSKSTIINIATAKETREVQDWFAYDGESRRYG